MKDFAIGEMGLMPHDFYRLTWADYCRASQGYWLRNAAYMDGVRKQCYFTVMMNSDPKKSRHLREEKLFRIATDPYPKKIKKGKAVTLSSDLFEAIKKRYKLN